MKYFVYIIVLILMFLGVSLYFLPIYVSHRVEEKLNQYDVDSEIIISSISLDSLILNAHIIKPIDLKIPRLKITWNLNKGLNQIPFEIFIVDEAVKVETKDLNSKVNEFLLSGVYKDKTINLTYLKSAIDLYSPVQTKILIESNNISQNLFRYRIQAPKQDVKNIQLLNPLKIIKDFEVEGKFELKENIEFEVNSINPIHLSSRFKEEIVDVKLDSLRSVIYYNKRFGIEVKSLSTSLQIDFDESNSYGFLNVQHNENNNSMDYRLNLKSKITGSSFLSTFKRLSISWIQKLNGFINIKFNGNLSNGFKLLKSDLLLDGRFHSGIIFSIPFNELKFNTKFNCVYLNELSCLPNSKQHLIEVKTIGDDYKVTNTQYKAHNVDNVVKGKIKFNWMDAKIKSKKLDLDMNKNLKLSSQLNINNLNLEKLFGLIGLSKVKATGRLNGEIKFDYSNADGLLLHPSFFKSIKKGHLIYKDPLTLQIPQKISTLKEFTGLLSMGQQALVFKALDNFHYESLSLNMERLIPGALKFKLRLFGANPELANGQNFDINVPIEGDLEGLIAESSFRSLAESQSSEEYVSRLRKLLKK